MSELSSRQVEPFSPCSKGTLLAFNTCTIGGCFAVQSTNTMFSKVPCAPSNQCSKAFIAIRQHDDVFPRFFCHWNTHAHARMHARTQSCLQNKFLLAPLTLSHHSFDPRLRRVGGHVLLEGTTQSVHASAVTMKEEQINFGCVSLCSGHGLFENNQGKCAQQTMQAWKKDTHCEKHRMA